MKKTWFVFLLALVVGGSVLVFSYGRGRLAKSETKMKTALEVVEAAKPLPREVRSGDGSMILILTGKELQDGQTDYSFEIKDVSKNSRWQIYAMSVGQNERIDLPFNAWSPNNKQVFVEYQKGREKTYLVFKADGLDYKEGEHHLDLVSYWQKGKNNYSVSTVTGWGGLDLLVVKTMKEDGNDGPSFWFVTSSRGFMQLRHT